MRAELGMLLESALEEWSTCYSSIVKKIASPESITKTQKSNRKHGAKKSNENEVTSDFKMDDIIGELNEAVRNITETLASVCKVGISTSNSNDYDIRYEQNLAKLIQRLGNDLCAVDSTMNKHQLTPCIRWALVLLIHVIFSMMNPLSASWDQHNLESNKSRKTSDRNIDSITSQVNMISPAASCMQGLLRCLKVSVHPQTTSDTLAAIVEILEQVSKCPDHKAVSAPAFSSIVSWVRIMLDSKSTSDFTPLITPITRLVKLFPTALRPVSDQLVEYCERKFDQILEDPEKTISVSSLSKSEIEEIGWLYLYANASKRHFGPEAVGVCLDTAIQKLIRIQNILFDDKIIFSGPKTVGRLISQYESMATLVQQCLQWAGQYRCEISLQAIIKLYHEFTSRMFNVDVYGNSLWIRIFSTCGVCLNHIAIQLLNQTGPHLLRISNPIIEYLLLSIEISRISQWKWRSSCYALMINLAEALVITKDHVDRMSEPIANDLNTLLKSEDEMADTRNNQDEKIILLSHILKVVQTLIAHYPMQVVNMRIFSLLVNMSIRFFVFSPINLKSQSTVLCDKEIQIMMLQTLFACVLTWPQNKSIMSAVLKVLCSRMHTRDLEIKTHCVNYLSTIERLMHPCRPLTNAVLEGPGVLSDVSVGKSTVAAPVYRLDHLQNGRMESPSMPIKLVQEEFDIHGALKRTADRMELVEVSGQEVVVERPASACEDSIPVVAHKKPKVDESVPPSMKIPISENVPDEIDEKVPELPVPLTKGSDVSEVKKEATQPKTKPVFGEQTDLSSVDSEIQLEDGTEDLGTMEIHMDSGSDSD